MVLLILIMKKLFLLKKYPQFMSWLQNPYPINFMTKMAKIDTLFRTKMAEKPYKEYPLPPVPWADSKYWSSESFLVLNDHQGCYWQSPKNIFRLLFEELIIL